MTFYLEPKKFYTSLTVWGGFASLFPAIVEATDKILGLGILPPNIAVIVSTVGGVAAIVGRVLAKQPIKL